MLMLMLMMLVPVTNTIRIPPGARKYNGLTGRILFYQFHTLSELMVAIEYEM